MRFLGIAAVAVLFVAGIMTSPASAIGPDGFVAQILPSSRDDNTWHGDWVKITIWTQTGSGWTAGGTGTLHIFMPVQSHDVTYAADPATGVSAHVGASVAVWEEVGTYPVVGDGSRTFVDVPRFLAGTSAPETPTMFSVSLDDGRESFRSLVANKATVGGNQDVADAIDSVGDVSILI